MGCIGGWDDIRDNDERVAVEDLIDTVFQDASNLRAKLKCFAIP